MGSSWGDADPCLCVLQYLERRFVKRVEGGVEESWRRLWEAVDGGDMQTAARILITSAADAGTTFEQAKAQEDRTEVEANTVGSGREEGEGGGGVGVEEGFDAEKLDKRGWSLLHLACSKGDLGAVEMVLQHGGGIEGEDTRGRRPLHISLVFQSLSVSKLLISRGAKVAVRDSIGRTPLDMAMEGGAVADEELFLMLADP